MSATPPAPWDREAADEAAFATLKRRLEGLWGEIFPGDDEHYTSVVIPSGEVAPDAPGADFDEERLLVLLIRLRNPRARMVFVTSRPVHPQVLEYYLEMLWGIPAAHARARLTLLCAHDTTPRPLAAKVLERPRLVERIRRAIFDPSRAYLTVAQASPLERRLAVALDLPLNAADPELRSHVAPAGRRRVFREAGLAVPRGVEGLRDEADVARALLELKREAPDVARAVVRLEDGGSAAFDYPSGDVAPADVERALADPAFGGGREGFLSRLARGEAVLEERMDGAPRASAEFRINPRRQIVPVSTHDVIEAGGAEAEGLWFPASRAYRSSLQDAGRRAAIALAGRGIVSRAGITFALRRRGEVREMVALGVELGLGRATHAMLALRFLTGGALDPETGEFRAPGGQAKAYRSTDALRRPGYSGLLPEDLIDIVAGHHLRFDARVETGVLFHMIGGLSQLGSIGLTAIGGDRDESDRLFARAVRVLDQEAANPSLAPR